MPVLPRSLRPPKLSSRESDKRTDSSSKEKSLRSPFRLDQSSLAPWSSRFFLLDFEPPGFSPRSSKASSEPPEKNLDKASRAQRSRSATPSLPIHCEDSIAVHSPPPLSTCPSTPLSMTASSPTSLAPHTLTTTTTQNAKPIISPPSIQVGPLSPSTPEISRNTAIRSPLDRYGDLFLMDPHEYDSITDGELVRLYDTGAIDAILLEQIINASMRIQRAVTDEDRRLSIKIRRAMIRHALED